MTTVLCTLYNSLYLDKGLVLYDSLCKCTKDFKLYVLCMDEKCFEVLSNLKQESHIPIKLSEFESGNQALLTAKANRSMGEYCWTCSSSFIKYILNRYSEEICTYIDADMFFYNDPQMLVDEMLHAGRSVMVVPHRFPERKETKASIVGKYCVEFNTFKNNKDSLEVLDYWIGRCLDCCSNLGDGIHWGDQKYLDELVDRFPAVHVCNNWGAGVAPWNIESYENYDNISNTLVLKQEKTKVNLVFYHFASLTYYTKKIISTSIVGGDKNIDYKLVSELYKAYLQQIDNKKEYLDSNYGINTLIKKHPSKKGPSNLKQRLSNSPIILILRGKMGLFSKGHSFLITL